MQWCSQVNTIIFNNNLTWRSLIICCWKFTGISKIASVKVHFFFQYSNFVFLKVWQISWNSNEWFSRNRRMSEKSVLHSIASFWLTMHALHLTGFLQLQRKPWQLLGFLHQYLFQHTLIIKDKVKTINTLHSVMKKNSSIRAGIRQIKCSLNWQHVCFVFAILVRMLNRISKSARKNCVRPPQGGLLQFFWHSTRCTIYQMLYK